jgi:hypothetical protein
MNGDVCRIDGCKKLVSGKTGRVCSMHLSRFWRSGGDFNYISPNWNNLKAGQALLSPLGYLRINIGGKRVLHHRHVMEKHLSRKLRSDEKIHHINGNKTDNRIENLMIVGQSEHIREHHGRDPLVDWSKIKFVKGARASRWHPSSHKQCFVPRCDIKPTISGLCFKHYISYRRNFLKK